MTSDYLLNIPNSPKVILVLEQLVGVCVYVCGNSSLHFINPAKLLSLWQPAKLGVEHNFVIGIQILKRGS